MKRTIVVQLDQPEAERLERVARSRNLSASACLAQAGVDAAHDVLLDQAVARFDQDPTAVSISELAEESGLAMEEIMQEIWRRDRLTAAATGQPVAEVVRSQYRGRHGLSEEALLASCSSIADQLNDPEFLDQARAIVRAMHNEMGR